MHALKAELLRGFWYMAFPGAQLARGKMRMEKMLGEPVLIGRDNNGKVFAISDFCPHRGMPLHYGQYDGNAVTCSYHAWRFDRSGTCVEIPSMMPDQQVDLGKIRCGSYPCIERQGIVWVYFARNGEQPSGFHAEPPKVPLFEEDSAPQFHCAMTFPVSIDHTFFGLVDPGHIAYVHTSPWFRAKARMVKPKEKHFEPVDFGFKMTRHVIPRSQTMYRVLGNRVTAEITTVLPGIRIEELSGNRHRVTVYTTVMPVTDQETVMHHMFFTTAKWASVFSPVVHYMMRTFMKQDVDIAARQREGLEFHPKLMLINDANTQGRWWGQLSDEWIASGKEGRTFVNPIKPKTLHWMS